MSLEVVSGITIDQVVAAIADEATTQPVFSTYDARGAAGTDATITAERIHLIRMPRVAKETTWTQASIVVAVIGGSVDLALIRDNPTGTGTRIAHTGLVTATLSRQDFALSGWTQLPDIDYWLAFGGDNATLSVRGVTVTSTINGLGDRSLSKDSAWSSGIPATITGATGQARTPLIVLTAA